MTSKSNAWRVGVLALGAAFVLVGCGSSVGGDATPSGSSTATNAGTGVAADVPSGFKPCDDVPQSVLDSERLRQKIPSDGNAAGGLKWRGCIWAKTNGYGAQIQTTNITVDMVRGKNFPGAHEFTVGSRAAISTRQISERPTEACTVNVGMQGGSLEINLTNPPSAKETGHLDTCELARGLAEKIVPTMPPNA
ncbi:DUF3558 domain-containing protein [Nocardia amikacinitolerans]|uniref:DUF3558 domain-containing protein n=1 Tax=Nocardia amikacinitolerans TaxID=756689 RepID=UPI0020A3349B|nr:DUF3558 domain-containing protein [Nocardia amikacinitolerans]MCP2279027.1 Protein of unknown function (DUF3558) [Nocardia amikacinitolerans]